MNYVYLRSICQGNRCNEAWILIANGSSTENCKHQPLSHCLRLSPWYLKSVSVASPMCHQVCEFFGEQIEDVFHHETLNKNIHEHPVYQQISTINRLKPASHFNAVRISPRHKMLSSEEHDAQKFLVLLHQSIKLVPSARPLIKATD